MLLQTLRRRLSWTQNSSRYGLLSGGGGIPLSAIQSSSCGLTLSCLLFFFLSYRPTTVALWLLLPFSAQKMPSKTLKYV